MSDDKLIPPGRGFDSAPVPVAADSSSQVPAPGGDGYYPAFEEGEERLDWRRYLFAIFRYKWLLLAGVLLGTGGALIAWRTIAVSYAAQGNVWIDAETRQNASDVTPIQTSNLFESSSWTDLLRSYQVLDSVVVRQKLYVRAPREDSAAFSTFSLGDQFAPGGYELQIGPGGANFTLLTAAGATVQTGRVGDAIGAQLGFEWTPPAGSLRPGATIDFNVLTPRDAALSLSSRLVTTMDRNGNFLQLTLNGSEPARLASILNAIMDRYIALAAELKRGKLDETLSILEEQLKYTEQELADAEQDLEEFRVTTISLPSDQSAITPGLQVTRDPVFDNFFNMRIQAEQIRQDRAALQAALNNFQDSGEVQIEALEVIPSAAQSSELRRILDDLVDERSQLRVLRARYADTYPPVQEVLAQIESIEQHSVPQVVQGILDELATRERDMRARLDTASAELQAIPPRTIEEGRLQRRVTVTENLYNELRSRVETARLAAASSIPDVRILDRAQVPQRPASDRRLLFAAAIFFGCLGAAVGGAILLDRTDARLRYASDVSRDIGLDILGSIPRIQSGRSKKGIVNAAQALEAFRELRIHTGFAYGTAGPITLTVSSPAAGEGKSLISSNLAVAFAEVGRRTLLIDGDTRRGDAHKLLGLGQTPGLIDYLRDRSGQEIIQQTPHDNLDFIACGSRGTSTPELLASTRMAHFMGTLKRSYDVIIIDSPPLAAGGDALILSTLAGNLAVVIRTGTTDRQLAQVKLDQLSRLPIRILGAILNDVDPSDGYHYYYSAYLPGYEPVPEEGEESVQLISGSES